MSRINRIRLVNFNYNHDATRISDELFNLNGVSTLFSLENGGGKSVLVQALSAPFVHKAKRNFPKRPFVSYFTSDRPSFIMIEWLLDDHAGYLLTGMMVRRSPKMDEDGSVNLDMINFIAFYHGECEEDIRHLDVIDHDGKTVRLHSFGQVKEMFERYKRDDAKHFRSYDMNNAAQSRAYFDKLMEYRISWREWENIIHKINEEEGGLSDLFSDCRNEKELIDKWFLDEIERKLCSVSSGDDRDNNMMKNFQELIEKYTQARHRQQDQIRLQARVRQFLTSAQPLQEKTENYTASDDEIHAVLSQMKGFCDEMTALKEESEVQEQTEESRMDGIETALARLQYEKLSADYYRKDARYQTVLAERQKAEETLNRDKEQQTETEKNLHIMEAARQAEGLRQEEREVSVLAQQLDDARHQEKDLTPEHDYLGYLLRSYYEGEVQKNRDAAAALKEKIQTNADAAAAMKKTRHEMEQKRTDLVQQCTSLKKDIEQYTEKEDNYNRRWNASLCRNVTGKYGNELEAEKKAADAGLQQKKNELKQLQRDQQDLEDRIHTSRSLRDRTIQNASDNQTAVKEADHTLTDYEKQKEVRLDILKYADLDENALYDTESIANALKTKRAKVETVIQQLTIQDSEKENELESLTEGRTVELPAGFEEALQEKGIQFVFGLNWLQNNQYSEEENRELLKHNPFLPYAILLTDDQIETLKDADLKIFTSHPIPIVSRDSLENREDQAGPLLRYGSTSFYMLFNDGILNSAKLEEMIAALHREIAEIHQEQNDRQAEADAYHVKITELQSQTLTEDRLEKARMDLSVLQAEGEKLKKKIADLKAEEEKLNQKKADLAGSTEQKKQEIRDAESRRQDLAQLSQAYQSYCRHLTELAAAEQAETDVQKRIDKTETDLEHLNDEATSLAVAQKELKGQAQAVMQKLQKYRSFEACQAPSSLAFDTADMAAVEERFEIIEKKTSGTIQSLKEALSKAEQRRQKASHALNHYAEKNQLVPADWQDTVYDQDTADQLENRKRDLSAAIEEDHGKLNQAEKNVGAAESDRRNVLADILKQCGKDEPLPAEEVHERDFTREEKRLQGEKESCAAEQERLAERIRLYASSRERFDGFDLPEKGIETEENFRIYDDDRMRSYISRLNRAFNVSSKNRDDLQKDLEHDLDQLGRRPEYQEEYFKRPMISLLNTLQQGSPHTFSEHLSAVVQSLQKRNEQLNVDLAFVKRDRAQLITQLFDYVKSVHTELGKIDVNSRIPLRGRSVKMMTISRPDWNTNAGIYRVNLENSFDAMVEDGMKILNEKDASALHDLVGRRVTTRQLYDDTVHTANVHLSLRKVEANRDIPITWKEAAANSGGEGTLSAFVILSSLLYYMRRDETDMFAQGNEGKVMIMDNPFGKLSSPHLLDPLMEVARKNNTQLICLTALSGSQIYEHFDNIYVLHLIQAGMNQNRQYLIEKHTKGTDEVMMDAARVEVHDSAMDDQLKLF